VLAIIEPQCYRTIVLIKGGTIVLRLCTVVVFVVANWFGLSSAVAQGGDSSTAAAIVLTKENIVDTAVGHALWSPAIVGQLLEPKDRVRTGDDSRAALRLSNLSVLRIDELTEAEILPPHRATAKATLDLKQGSAYLFSREKSQEVEIVTPAATGAIRGTEFVASVSANGHSVIIMLDGELKFSNAQGSVLVHSGEQASADPGSKPTKTAVINALSSIQWCLYYPGVLDLNELKLLAADQQVLSASTSAYSAGDLLTALKEYPKGRSASSASEKVYRAGLYLVVGQVPKAKLLLSQIPEHARGRCALAVLIAAVTLQPRPSCSTPQSASEWIAESYYLQSKADLEGALQAARKALELDPSFGFAWTRVAELEFSFGRIPRSLAALEKGLEISARNPQAHALRGFLLSAENKIGSAGESFDAAIAIDGALGNAWLGRGLCLIRQGKDEQGRLDLQTGAALEPNRSILHSYLGKGFINIANEPKARQELTRAEQLDPHDPTPWLYSALENRQDNRTNEAVGDLEESIGLNDNRRIYRSLFLLDQDRAVRSANLAAIYQDDGMDELSLREATRAVDSDYSSASAHLFLANSYNALRDPKRINLRYETQWSNELLLSNLLSPVGGGPLSQYVSEQEYSKLFEADGLGISSTTTYLSTGDIRETASQFGLYENVSYSIDTDFQYDRGQRPNNEITRSESYGQAKVQLSPQDSIFIQTKYQDTRNGDVFQYYDQANAAPGYNAQELEQPSRALIGYHHEWSPGVHTLLLFGRLSDDITVSNLNTITNTDSFLNKGFPNVSRIDIFALSPTGQVSNVFVLPMDLQYHSTFTIYTGEINQIWEWANNTCVAGARFQGGEFDTSDLLKNEPPQYASLFAKPPAKQAFATDFERQSFYFYDIWRPAASLSITGAISYDRLTYPSDYRNPPITDSESSRSRVSPKAGLIWNPFGDFVVRGAYTRSLGGVSFDENIQLEPTSVAGFNEVFRNIISESIVGSVEAPKYQNGGLILEEKLSTRTYAAIEGNILTSDVDRRVGVFEAFLGPGLTIPGPIFPSSTPQRLHYQEDDLSLVLNQLVTNEWSLGARYQVSFSDLAILDKDVPKSAAPTGFGDNRSKATLHQAGLFALFHHRSGFFAESDIDWYRQSNVGYDPNIPGDDFWQVNGYIGYRFRRNLGDIALGLLDFAGQNYKLNPLNYYNDLPRERTVFLRVRLNL
jgi:tetratricopeptide (TPR) repeat protein